MIDLEAVAAVADDGTIGDDGSIPWDHPEDLERFQDITAGSALVMGRRTYESILERRGRPLTDCGRTIIVLSETMKPPEWAGVIVTRSLDAAVGCAARLDHDIAYVCGGAEIYREALPACSRLHLTRVHATPAGDTRFPDWERDEWLCVRSDAVSADLTFLEYERAYRGFGDE